MRYENAILFGDALTHLKSLPDDIVQCCVTSPLYYGLRDYGAEGQIGLEKTPHEYFSRLVEVFREVRRVLRKDGTLWLNLGDSYAGSWGNQGRKDQRGSQRTINQPMFQPLKGYGALDTKTKTGSWVKDDPALKPKDLIGVPWRTALALQEDGWYLRSDIIWAKPNPLPESVKDRPTKSHEYLFLLANSESYFYDSEAIKEPATGRSAGNKRHRGVSAYREGVEHHRTKSGLLNTQATTTRNRRTVWSVSPVSYKGAHFAVMPEELVRLCVLAGSRPEDLVLDPFAGSGTTLAVARSLGRRYLGIELNQRYSSLIEERLKKAWDLDAGRRLTGIALDDTE